MTAKAKLVFRANRCCWWGSRILGDHCCRNRLPFSRTPVTPSPTENPSKRERETGDRHFPATGLHPKIETRKLGTAIRFQRRELVAFPVLRCCAFPPDPETVDTHLGFPKGPAEIGRASCR